MNQVTIQQKFIDFANIFKAFIGSIYLTMPFAFYKSGIIPGVVLLMIIGYINDHCCTKIVQCKTTIINRLMVQFEEKLKNGILAEPEAELVRSGRLKSRWEDRMTLSHIAKYAFGKKGQWIVTICLFISQFGFCTGYMVFVGNTLHDIIYPAIVTNKSTIISNSTVAPTTGVKIDLIYLILMFVPIFCLFALVRSIRKLGPVSVLANITICFGFFMVLGIMLNGFSISPTFELAAFKTIAVVFGMLTTAFEGIGTVIPIESSMIGNRHNFPPYIHATIGGIVLILGSFGLVGHLRYGEDTQQIILQNLPSSVLVTIVNIILIVSVICTFPLQMYPCVEIAEFLFFRKRSSELKEDRLKTLAGDEAAQSDYNTDIEREQDELLAELSASESEAEIVENNRKKRRRRYKRSTGVINSKGSTNYGSTLQTDINTNVDDEQNQQDPNDEEDNVLTKKEERMMRIVRGDKINAAAWKRNLIRITIVILQLLLAIVMRYNYAYLSSFIGALGSSVLAYMLPGATHFKLTKFDPETKFYQRAFDIFLILFGIVGSIVSIVFTVMELVGA